MRNKYNSEHEGTVRDEGTLEIVNDPSDFAHTELGKTICKDVSILRLVRC
jgi:hypothetical protein